MSSQYKLSTPWYQRSRSLLGAIAVGAALVVLPSCNSTGQEEISEDQTNVTTEDLASEDLSTEGTGLDNIDSLIGQEVTVRSTVHETLGDSGLALTTNNEPILVINATTAPFSTPAQDIPVQVTGEVAEFVLTDIENEYGLDLDETVYADYEGQPVIIADSLALSPSAEDLAENPDPYMNQVIAMQGDVRDVLSDGAFTMFDEGWVDDYGILVVGVDRSLKADDVALQEGESVVVTGSTQPFDADALQQEYNLNLTDEQLNEFSESYNRPVIVAEEIYPSAVDK